MLELEKYYFKTQYMLNTLPLAERRLLQEKMTKREEKKDKVLFRAGTQPSGIYFLQKGKVKIYQTTKEGKEHIVYIYGKDDILGYRPILCNERHPVSASTLEDCKLNFVSKKAFVRILDQSPTLVRQLLTNLSYEFTVWVNKITVFGQQPVKERLALSLLILGEKYKTSELPAIIGLSRSDLANYTGTSVETLVRTLKVFKEKGIISTQGRLITIVNSQLLHSIADL